MGDVGGGGHRRRGPRARAPAWWNAGSLEYDLPTNALLAIQSLVMGALEYNSRGGWVATGQSGVAGAYPFDPLNLRSDSMATKEVKHGRLAMLAFAGIVAQAVVYRVGPLNASSITSRNVQVQRHHERGAHRKHVRSRRVKLVKTV